jgi:hypothetical protein
MIQIHLALGLIATCLIANAGACGRGSRRTWIACIFLGVLVASVSIVIAKVYEADIRNALVDNEIAIGFLKLMIGAAISFSIGSLSAALLFPAKPASELLRTK